MQVLVTDTHGLAWSSSLVRAPGLPIMGCLHYLWLYGSMALWLYGCMTLLSSSSPQEVNVGTNRT